MNEDPDTVIIVQITASEMCEVETREKFLLVVKAYVKSIVQFC